jgi:predicted MarR family transcription regulator
VRIEATAAGRKVMEEGRARRLAALTAAVSALPAGDRATLARAAAVLQQMTGKIEP